MTYSRVREPSPSRVLLVDDNRSVLHAIYTLLESEGYEVLAAGNGLDGLAVFRQSIRPVELLVTDYNMPRMSGLELARECSWINCELCVLYISAAHPDEPLRADLYEPKRAFLAKPFRTDDLLRKARELLLEPPRQLPRLKEAIGNGFSLAARKLDR
jgi:CheY-like chemotaxis protein